MDLNLPGEKISFKKYPIIALGKVIIFSFEKYDFENMNEKYKNSIVDGA